MTAFETRYNNTMEQLVRPGEPFELVDCPEIGRGSKAFLNAPKTMRELFAPAYKHGQKEFLLYEGERWSFERLLHDSHAIGHWLLDHQGVEKGCRVAIAMRNCPEWMAAYIAITCIGAVVVPVNAWGQGPDIEFVLQDSGSTIVFCDQQRYDLLSTRFDELGVVPIVVREKEGKPGGGALTYGQIVSNTGRTSMPDVDLGESDEAMIMYTSGTTGFPKGAVSTHRAVCQSIYATECQGAAMVLCNRERMDILDGEGFPPCRLLSVPLFHVSGCHATFLVAIRSGTRLVMMYKWDLDTALRLVEAERVTRLGGAPKQVLEFLESAADARSDLRSLGGFGIGGDATPPRLRRLIQEAMPHHMSGTGWGMTETNSIGTNTIGELFDEQPASAGICNPIVEISIRDKDFVEVPPGDDGEIWVRSVAMTREYWNRPEANAECFRDGWFNSGDLGRLDRNNCLYLSGRVKDVIIRGGENVYPAEIESTFLQHADVQEAAVFGVDSEAMGEEVAVVVKLKSGSPMSEKDVLDYALQHLSHYKVPGHVFIADTPLPRTATNKLMRDRIRADYQIALAE
ncbi:MAG: class I adenylate-forming enzyme family protein [Halioglobus sp.]|nr:class I adenylate-forming enzyme family protein [Halioglobus sp.]